MHTGSAHIADWAPAVAARFRQRVAPWLRRSIAVPPEPGGWWHDYVCPVHGIELLYAPQRRAQHRCPLGDVHRGRAYAAAWRVYRHRELSQAAADLAWLYAYSGEQRFGERAGAILAAYDRLYPTWAPADGDGRGWMLAGRAFRQALTEALWAVDLARAVDTLQRAAGPAAAGDIASGLAAGRRLLSRVGQTLAAAHREQVEERSDPGHNYTAWLDAALGAIGFALGDMALVRQALDGPGGFYAHMGRAVGRDGLEWEGSTYYHLFVLRAYVLQAEAALPHGANLYTYTAQGGQSIGRMVAALCTLAGPDGRLPALHDAPWRRAAMSRELAQVCEIALARLGETAVVPLLRRAYADLGTRRDQPEALLGGRDLDATSPGTRGPGEVPGAPVVGAAVRHLEDAGLSALRSPGGGLVAVLDWGPHGGPHGHLDKLAFSLLGPGGELTADPGSPPYGSAWRRSWYVQTAAHNTLLVDGQGQAEAAGRLLGSGSGGWFAWVAASAGPAYPGVAVERRLLLTDRYLVDWLEAAAPRRHRFEYLLHGAGRLAWHGVEPRRARGTLGRSGAAAWIRRRQVAAAGGSWWARFSGAAGAGGALWVGCPGPMPGQAEPVQLWGAAAPGRGDHPSAWQPVLLLRVAGRAARFVTVLAPGDAEPPAVRWLDPGERPAPEVPTGVRALPGQPAAWLELAGRGWRHILGLPPGAGTCAGVLEESAAIHPKG